MFSLYLLMYLFKEIYIVTDVFFISTYVFI